MNEKLKKDSMTCPCCGGTRLISEIECGSCNARQIGEPLLPPDVLLPKLGPSFMALAWAGLVVLTFLVIWIFGNDIKVGRALLVWAFGESTELTRGLLQADSKLPYYRIFSYDAYRMAYMFAGLLIPLSLIGSWIGWKAVKKARTNPKRFGGLRLARVAATLSVCLFMTLGIVTVTSLPGAIARRQAKRVAATSAAMYALHYEMLQKYYREHGTYPQELTDTPRLKTETVTQNDNWDNSFSYSPVGGVIASRENAPNFSGYKLVSSGPDGKFGTADDITMIDGIIIEGKTDNDPSSPSPTPEKSRP